MLRTIVYKSYVRVVSPVSLSITSSRNFSVTRKRNSESLKSIEPSFYEQGLGLANHTPSGVMQAILEHAHISLDLPWWATIVTGEFKISVQKSFTISLMISATVTMRIIIFPFFVSARRAQARTINLLPETQKIEMEMHSATNLALSEW